MKRTGMPRRLTPLPRGTRINKSKTRSAIDFARIYGSKARVQWVKSLPCVACSAVSPYFVGATAGSSHNAHTVTGGTGRKAGYETIVPLCAPHHRRYDEHKRPFDTPEAREAMKATAARIQAEWLELSA